MVSIVCGDLGRLKSTKLLYAGGAEVKKIKLWKTFDFKYHLSSRAAPPAALSSPELAEQWPSSVY